jgi:hypothetical protein
MGFSRFGHEFDGPYADADKLQNVSGMYVIWCKSGDNWRVLDVGESSTVRDRVLTHDRQPCWEKNCKGTIMYSATYTPNRQQSGRRQIENEIRDQTNPPCGER